MKNPTLVEIGKILIRLSVLQDEIKGLKKEKHAIIRGVNNQRIHALFGEMEEIKYSFERYKQLRAHSHMLRDQLKLSAERQRIVSQRIFSQ